MKYQLGSRVVSGQEKVIVHCQDTYLDLSSLTGGRQATSLMQMMEAWPSWRELLCRFLKTRGSENCMEKLKRKES